MNIDACFQLGYIVKTHGIKGQVVAFFDVDFPEDYEDLESVFLEQKGRLVPFFIALMEPVQKRMAEAMEQAGRDPDQMQRMKDMMAELNHIAILPILVPMAAVIANLLLGNLHHLHHAKVRYGRF